MKTHYDTLQVLESASPEVIKGAYKFLLRKWHPDKNPNQKEEAERIARVLNQAYFVLSDSERRTEYDLWLKAQRYKQTQAKKNYYRQAQSSTSKSKNSDDFIFNKSSPQPQPWFQLPAHMAGRIGLGLAIIAITLGIVAVLAFSALFLTEPSSFFRPLAAFLSTAIVLMGMCIGLYIARDTSSYKN